MICLPFQNSATQLGKEKPLFCFFARLFSGFSSRRLRKPYASPTDSYLNSIGIAAAEITSSQRGRVKLHGSWWFALSNSNVIIKPGQRVRITGRQYQTLMIELSHHS